MNEYANPLWKVYASEDGTFDAAGYECAREEIVFEEMTKQFHEKNWDSLCDKIILCGHARIMELAFNVFFNRIPENKRRELALECYNHNGDHSPAVRRAVRNLERKGKEELPPEYACQEVITVYRGGEEPPEKAPNRLSWTLDKEMAIFFCRRIGKAPKRLYMAKIKTKDIISYYDERNEKEVIQYRKVFDVKEIPINKE